jgi:quercetin dioxygenase-like cupin family protein
MMSRKSWPSFVLTIACGAAIGHLIAQLSNNSAGAKVSTVFSRVLPKLDGGHLSARIVEVVYGPGGASSPHSHPCPVIGYVLEGAIRIQVKGQPEAIYKAGQSFYEAPNGIHQVSANASGHESAKFLAYFLCDHDTPLSVPISGDKSQ